MKLEQEICAGERVIKQTELVSVNFSVIYQKYFVESKEIIIQLKRKSMSKTTLCHFLEDDCYFLKLKRKDEFNCFAKSDDLEVVFCTFDYTNSVLIIVGSDRVMRLFRLESSSLRLERSILISSIPKIILYMAVDQCIIILGKDNKNELFKKGLPQKIDLNFMNNSDFILKISEDTFLSLNSHNLVTIFDVKKGRIKDWFKLPLDCKCQIVLFKNKLYCYSNFDGLFEIELSTKKLSFVFQTQLVKNPIILKQFDDDLFILCDPKNAVVLLDPETWEIIKYIELKSYSENCLKQKIDFGTERLILTNCQMTIFVFDLRLIPCLFQVFNIEESANNNDIKDVFFKNDSSSFFVVLKNGKLILFNE